jgi:hypothetical protein
LYRFRDLPPIFLARDGMDHHDDPLLINVSDKSIGITFQVPGSERSSIAVMRCRLQRPRDQMGINWSA